MITKSTRKMTRTIRVSEKAYQFLRKAAYKKKDGKIIKVLDLILGV